MADIQTLAEETSVQNTTKFIANDGKVRSYETVKNQIANDLIITSYEGDATDKTLSQIATKQLVSTAVNNLAEVSRTGSYNDLLDQPTIPPFQIQADWNQTDITLYDYINNKPSLANVALSGSYNDLTNVPSASETVAGTLKISTTAQVTGGVDNTSAITPAKLHEHLNNVKEVSVTVSGSGVSATGYTIFKDITTGAIVRKVVWGRYNTITSDNGRNITFPITFTTIHSPLISIVQNGGNTDASPDSPAHIRDLSLTGVRLCNADALQTVDLSIQITGV